MLSGLDALLSFLAAARSSFAEHSELKKIGFLLDRATADFETAVDATLAGFNSVASESMRDVMEIQFLVRDFAAEPENLEEWLNADRQLRYNKYRPALLRGRQKKRLGAENQNSGEDADYAAHSQDLHVNPKSFLSKGLLNLANPIEWDIAFSEMFEHGERLIRDVANLVDRVAPGLDAGPELDAHFPEFFRALAATMKKRLFYRKWLEKAVGKNSNSYPEE